MRIKIGGCDGIMNGYAANKEEEGIRICCRRVYNLEVNKPRLFQTYCSESRCKCSAGRRILDFCG